MKIKKEYGEIVYQSMLSSECSPDALDFIFQINEHNPLEVFINIDTTPFSSVSDMFLYLDDLKREYETSPEKCKEIFFNQYVEGGYQELLYYVEDKYTGQILCNIQLKMDRSTIEKWLGKSFVVSETDLAKHTKQEWLDINPAYEKMLVEVEE
ncbi:hypothetical protein [Lactobacillus terrae]|uniref:hypothetical protein n=1 Tax=Lactobacillus terrae TaxID=2269374 RepID=UPI000C1B7C20|nr:hypothetical protein [Lactobacillus terrae]